MKGNYLSSMNIVERLYRFLPDYIKFNIEEIYEFIYEALKYIGGNNYTILSRYEIQLEDGRCKIPSNVEDIMELSWHDVVLNKVDFIDKIQQCVYTVDNGYIYTDRGNEVINLIVSYFPTDEQGYPMLPDLTYFTNAVLAYLIERYMYKEFLKDKININKYEMIKRDWIVKAGNARVISLLPRIDEEYKLDRAILKVLPIKLHRNLLKVKHNPVPNVPITNLNDLILTQQPSGNTNDLTAPSNQDIRTIKIL